MIPGRMSGAPCFGWPSSSPSPLSSLFWRGKRSLTSVRNNNGFVLDLVDLNERLDQRRIPALSLLCAVGGEGGSFFEYSCEYILAVQWQHTQIGMGCKVGRLWSQGIIYMYIH